MTSASAEKGAVARGDAAIVAAMLEALDIREARPMEDGLCVRVGPFLFRARTAPRTAQTMLQHVNEGGATMWCRVEMGGEREAPTLIGFADPLERDLYDVLRAVPGIGPASALAVVGVGEPLDVLRAVAQGETAFFTQVPGIGTARARTICERLSERFAGALPAPLGAPVGAWVQAREGLLHSGMDAVAAERALATAVAAGHTDAEGMLATARRAR